MPKASVGPLVLCTKATKEPQQFVSCTISGLQALPARGHCAPSQVPTIPSTALHITVHRPPLTNLPHLTHCAIPAETLSGGRSTHLPMSPPPPAPRGLAPKLRCCSAFSSPSVLSQHARALLNVKQEGRHGVGVQEQAQLMLHLPWPVQKKSSEYDPGCNGGWAGREGAAQSTHGGNSCDQW